MRQSYRPDAVKILFVGESPPAGGTFFYAANSIPYRATLAGFQIAFPSLASENFLFTFKAMGCYLIDLCEQPVNRMPEPKREQIRKVGIRPLGQALRYLQPQAVIVVMKKILPHAEQAKVLSGIQADLYAFPGPNIAKSMSASWGSC